MCSLLNISHSRTTIFHPQSNGLVERFYCSVQTSLNARLAGPDWFEHLPLVMLGLRSTPRDDSSLSAAEALFGAHLCLPGEFLYSNEVPPSAFLERVQSSLRELVLPPLHHHASSAARVPAALASAGFVFARKDASVRPLSQLY